MQSLSWPPHTGSIHQWMDENNALGSQKKLQFGTGNGVLQAVWFETSHQMRHTIFSTSFEEKGGDIFMEQDKILFAEHTNRFPINAENALAHSLTALQDAYGDHAKKKKNAIGRCVYRLKNHPKIQKILKTVCPDLRSIPDFLTRDKIVFDDRGEIQLRIEGTKIPLLKGVDFRPFLGRTHIIQYRNNAVPAFQGKLPIQKTAHTSHGMLQELHEDIQTLEQGGLEIGPWMPFITKME